MLNPKNHSPCKYFFFFTFIMMASALNLAFFSLHLGKSGYTWRLYASSFENLFVTKDSFVQMKSSEEMKMKLIKLMIIWLK